MSAQIPALCTHSPDVALCFRSISLYNHLEVDAGQVAFCRSVILRCHKGGHCHPSISGWR